MRRAPVLLLLPAFLAGCGGVWSSYDVGPDGLRRHDAELRRLLAERRYERAFEQLSEAAPEDELLGLLYAGVVGYYAGEYQGSAEALDRAALLAEDRYTKSVSRAAASMLTSDYTIEYEPASTERLLIHYYAALDYLARDDADGAAVEARRLSALLEQTEHEARPTPELRRVLRYFAGAVFEAAGETNDAAVAYRHAQGRPAAGLDSLDGGDSLPGTGELVLLVERGFVAHRTEQAAIIALDGTEAHALTAGDDGRRWDVATLLAGRVLAELAATEPYGRHRDGTVFVDLPDDPALRFDPACDEEVSGEVAEAGSGPSVAAGEVPAPADTIERDRRSARADCELDDLMPYILKIAWPRYERSGTWPTLDVPAGHAAMLLDASVSDAVIADFERDRALLVARTLARAAAKMALTKAIEREAAERDETLGAIAGLLGNLGGLLTERADIRCWGLLPARLSVVRLRLPAGQHSLRVGADGALRLGAAPENASPGGTGPVARSASAAEVRIPEGGVAVAALRLWR
ncbi:MAG: hypothetical protein ACRELV_09275 [Longimicrobiales bacterium]